MALAIFPLAPDQTIAQVWSNGVRGGSVVQVVVFVIIAHYLAHVYGRPTHTKWHN